MSSVRDNPPPTKKLTDRSIKLIVVVVAVAIGLAIGYQVMKFVVAKVSETLGRSDYYAIKPPPPPTTRSAFTPGPTDPAAPRAAADEFFNLLRQNRVIEAHERTTRAFHDDKGLSEFQALIRQYPAFVGSTRVDLTPEPRSTVYVIYRGSVSGPNGQANVVVEVRLDTDDHWKVDRLTVQ